jgi:hypothetical protein
MYELQDRNVLHELHEQLSHDMLLSNSSDLRSQAVLWGSIQCR